jgi:acetyl-CoA acetyltransferase
MVLYRHELSSPAQADTARNLPAVAERHDLMTVPAAWPSGVSALAQAVDACQRSDSEQLSTDWLARVQSNRVAAGFLPS